MAAVEGVRSSVTFEGLLFWREDLTRWIALCRKLLEGRIEEAVLKATEPNLSIVFRRAGSLGHVEAEIEITGDHLNEQHRFLQQGDLSDLEAFTKALAQGAKAFQHRT